ncbi:reverse transcriptase [Tanacetum coccineum]
MGGRAGRSVKGRVGEGRELMKGGREGLGGESRGRRGEWGKGKKGGRSGRQGGGTGSWMGAREVGEGVECGERKGKRVEGAEGGIWGEGKEGGKVRRRELFYLVVLAEEEENNEETVDAEDELVELTSNELLPYYRRFIKDSATLSRHLTQLLKKNAFKWIEEAQTNLLLRKEAMIKALVLGLLDFNKPFAVETDASRVGVGSSVTTRWPPYSLFNLKYLLDQKITTPTQMKWFPMLMGFHYEVKQTWTTYDKLKAICDKLKESQDKRHYAWVNDQLLRKGKLVLPLAELWYNSNYHSAINTTPFEALYGQPPPVHVPYMGGISSVNAVDRSLDAKEKVVQLLKFHLGRAQNRMKQQTDKNMFERVLAVGDWVWLELQPHKQIDTKGLIEVKTMKLLDRKIMKKRNTMVVYGLIQWTNGGVQDATWELLEEFCKRFPEFDLDS